MSNFLEIPEGVYHGLLHHLLPQTTADEQAAFLFARPEAREADTIFRLVDWYAVEPEAFAYQSSYGLELAHAEHGRAIKRAHDLGSSLVEVHSHPFAATAAFSASDRAGLREFVPHVWWRLKAKPYVAMVIGQASFDALVWLADPNVPQQLDGLMVGERVLKPTAVSLHCWEESDGE
jgi:hypothetical protein